MSDTNTNTSNGTETPKRETALDALHKQWVAKGSRKPDEKTAKSLMAAYVKASNAREAAEQTFAAAKEEESKAATAIILSRGKGRFKAGGVIYTAMSKGDSVFLRKDGGEDLDSFG